jgi:hypothetical protein
LELYRDDDVECVREVTPGEFAGENVGFGQHMHVLSGEATVTSDDGTTVELRPGATFVARAGWRGHWKVRQTVRKSMPSGQSRDMHPPAIRRHPHYVGLGRQSTPQCQAEEQSRAAERSDCPDSQAAGASSSRLVVGLGRRLGRRDFCSARRLTCESLILRVHPAL